MTTAFDSSDIVLWLVGEVNQASHQIETIHGPYLDRREAEDALVCLTNDTRARGRREEYHILAAVDPEAL